MTAPRWLRNRGAISLLALGLAFFALVGPAQARWPGATRQAASPHVVQASDRAYIADARGRELLLRGVNVNALIQYPDYFQEQVPVSRADFREMAALGFNFVRLPFSWSLLAPAPGRIDRGYLDEIAQTVRAAEHEGLYVLVDSHQDRYNRNLRPGDEADGAPDWATLTDGRPCTPGAFVAPCAQAALDHFWNDTEVAGEGLQGHYLDALLAVSRRLRSDRRLLGIELLNEPTFGSTAPPAFERSQLWPFYRRMIAGLRGDGERRMIWFEPDIARDVTDADIGQPQRFSSDPNLVYAPHIYTGVFAPPGPSDPANPARMLQSFVAAEQEARTYGAALVDGEWGGGSGGDWETWRERMLNLQDALRIGSAFWIWKQQPGFYDWQTVELDGSLRTDSMRAQQLSRPRVIATPGRLLSTQYLDRRLSDWVDGPGGWMSLWSGTAVRGGPGLVRPLTTVLLDGHRVKAWLQPERFRTASVALEGYRLVVHLPAGEHSVDLVAGP